MNTKFLSIFPLVLFWALVLSVGYLFWGRSSTELAIETTTPTLKAPATLAIAESSPTSTFIPTPKSPPGVEISFEYDRSIYQKFGDCITLFWMVENVQEVRLNGLNVRPRGSQTVCPTEPTSIYRLTVTSLGGESYEKTLTFTAPSTPTPTPTLVPTFAPTTIPTPTPLPEAIVVANGLNLRSGPGTNYNVIDSLNKGDILDIQGRIASNEWIQVALTNLGTSGWVATAPELVQINIDLNLIPIVKTPPPPSPSTPTPVPIPTVPLITVAPTLLNPQPNATQYRNRIELEWDWPGILRSDDYFQVEIRNRYNAFAPVIDESVPPIDVAWVKDKFYQHDYVNEAYDREFTWRVIVVRGIPPAEKQWSTPERGIWEPAPKDQVEQISQPSEMRMFYVEPGDKPPPGNESGGGDNQPPDSGGGPK